MSKKRNKKYNPVKTIMYNEKLNHDYIVYAIDSMALGVISKKTGKPVRVDGKTYDALQFGICRRNCYAGCIYKDENDELQLEFTHLIISRCKGSETMPYINEETMEVLNRVGAENVLCRCYFITGDCEYEWDDVQVYQWLSNAGVFEQLTTRKDYIKDELSDMEDFMAKTDFKKHQIGGNHYARLSVQPIDVIKAMKLSWNWANAVKYLVRYDYKNGQQDLAKAYDYIQRELTDGFDKFYRPKYSKDDKLMFVAMAEQFEGKKQQALLSLLQSYTTTHHSKDKWEGELMALLFDINELCKVQYGVQAY